MSTTLYSFNRFIQSLTLNQPQSMIIQSSFDLSYSIIINKPATTLNYLTSYDCSHIVHHLIDWVFTESEESVYVSIEMLFWLLQNTEETKCRWLHLQGWISTDSTIDTAKRNQWANMLLTWPYGKLPCECQKMPKTWHFFHKNCQKQSFFSKKLPLAIFLKKNIFLAIFF